MRLKKITAIILAISPHKEIDKRILILSKEYGKLPIIAKGVKKITSRRNFHIDLLNESVMEIEENGNSETKYLREISTINSFKDLKKRPQNFSVACLIAYFIERVLPMDFDQRNIYDITLEALSALNRKGEDEIEENAHKVRTNYPAKRGSGLSERILFIFMLKTLKLLGYMPPKITEKEARPKMLEVLNELDPQFTLNARRTLWTFSKFPSTRSS